MFQLYQKWFLFLQLAAEKKTPFFGAAEQIFSPSYFDRALVDSQKQPKFSQVSSDRKHKDMGLNYNKVVWLEHGHKIFIRRHNDRTQQGAMVLVNKCITLISEADPKIYTKYYK